MRLYLDASVLLRHALHQPQALGVAATAAATVTSVLTEVECLRTLDRLFARQHLSADDIADARAAVYDALEISDLVALHPAILRRAAAPLPTPLATLDALHLATALLLGELDPDDALTFATHDAELARCARACGLDVVGV